MPMQYFSIDYFVKEVNDNAWIVLGEAMISRHSSKPIQPHWEDDEGFFFTMEKTPSPRPPTRAISDSCPISDVLQQSMYNLETLLKIGKAHLHVTPNIGAKEHNTLKAVAEKSYNFMVPTEYCHGEYGDFYYIAYSILPGKSIAEIWPKTKDKALRAKWACQIADAYSEMAKWRGDAICGVDGGHLWETRISKDRADNPRTFTPEVLRKNFDEAGIDCSNIVFCHNHVTPLCFTVDEDRGLLGITRWSAAGFVPTEWPQTAAQSNGFLEASPLTNATWTREDKQDWREQILTALYEIDVFSQNWPAYANWNDTLRWQTD
ncbi:hypothetical protein FPOAC2_08725 [Fusarium poae]|uniref:Aminoglycoside phosphotransferase domain-containing protein n=1 Tax=Fusarium poae TaxID=36050 RepID=A0A1B8AM66_FUSPO|nr:hypothetical protein FPOAC1_008792 [Fusarium poae]KAG8669397.1 hypothetical protein FPOAC1_008792 [Fusarium poae]OBS21623.1 hypothetical protein FPOA_07959 [Fusarium poae]